MTSSSQAVKRVYLKTFGCQMNERDSEGVKGLLLQKGYDFTDDIEGAEVILFNTCSVRQHAEDRLFGRAGRLSQIKQEKPDTVIGVLGCMAQEHGKTFFRRIPSLNLVCGPGNISEIPDILEKINQTGAKITATNRINDMEYSMDGIQFRNHDIKASVNIMSGCDHRCTYCIVPTTRGIERSRPSQDIVEEIRELVARGFKEVLLLGQNVNCYGKKLEENTDFVNLLEKIDQEAKPERIRFTTSHPKDAHKRLFDAMRDLPSVCEHLHLPVQSGSSRVLKRMKREHTRDWYMERIQEYRQSVPDGSLSTDIIVGFCGETDDDFRQTKSLMEQASFDSAYIFKYSVRPGTPASKLEDDISEKVKDERLQEILALQKSLTLEKNSKLIGKSVEVLFEDYDDSTSKAFGRTRQFKRVVVESPFSLKGELKKVEIKQVYNETLIGDLG